MPLGVPYACVHYFEGSSCRSLTAFIGMDYLRGLAMLKDHLEPGIAPAKQVFRSITDSIRARVLSNTRSGYPTEAAWAEFPEGLVAGGLFRLIRATPSNTSAPFGIGEMRGRRE